MTKIHTARDADEGHKPEQTGEVGVQAGDPVVPYFWGITPETPEVHLDIKEYSPAKITAGFRKFLAKSRE